MLCVIQHHHLPPLIRSRLQFGYFHNNTSFSGAAKKHVKWIILSLAEATVADGGGFSAAIVMAQKASGLSVEAVAYSIQC